MDKSKLKELAEFYARAAAMKDPVIKFNGKKNGKAGPWISSDMKNWTVEERQSDFQCLIDSGIDCEFSNDGVTWRVAKLKEGKYMDGFGDKWRHCRPRLNHIHAWIATEDSKCPVPEGYEVAVIYPNGCLGPWTEPAGYNWGIQTGINRIVAFEVRPK